VYNGLPRPLYCGEIDGLGRPSYKKHRCSHPETEEPIHLIAVPQSQDALARAIGEAHRRYTRRINFREKWRGYLWQGRFASFVMDEPYLLAAARYGGEKGRKGDGSLLLADALGFDKLRTCLDALVLSRVVSFTIF